MSRKTERNSLFSYVFYPGTVGLSMMGVIGLLQYLEPETLVWMPLMISIPLVIFLLLVERRFPYDSEWNINRGDFVGDLGQTFVTLPVAGRLIEFVLEWVLGIFIVTNYSLAPKFQFSGIGMEVIHFVGVLLASEFCYYWAHRWSHKWSKLWNFHRVHHGAERVYWANSGRFHFVDALWGSFAYMLPIIVLGGNSNVGVYVISFSLVTGYLEHVNVAFTGGWLNYVFNTAQLHRWHHSEMESESNSNFGKALIVFDLIFGSYYLPNNKVVKNVGIENEKVPTTFWAQWKYPFVS